MHLSARLNRGQRLKSDITVSRPVLTSASRALYLRILSGASQQKPSTALNHLLDADLVAPDPRKGNGHYAALNPTEATRQWQSALQLTAARCMAEAQLVPSQLDDLVAAYRLAHPTRSSDGIECVVGLEEINARLEVLVPSCQTELITAQPTGPRPAHVLAISYERDLGVLARGAKMRTLYLPSARHDRPTARWAETMAERGAEIRTSNSFGRAIIVDRRVAVTSVRTADGEVSGQALFVTDEGVVRTILAAFERDWARAERWDGRDPGVELGPLDRGILDGLAQGQEQEEIATGLELSKRTVAKHVALLKERTGSRSLAQLMYWYARREYQL
ncbi:LuxR C-terminal-related transcriptional regulator [Kitasatospora sp. NPDC001175]|uniref:LuxR C-terminal-related transcriptional regulator n=1 Tax=Kitasatospora sp. NPDC001175 TaxID=3157103 RepID=UPI003D045376